MIEQIDEQEMFILKGQRRIGTEDSIKNSSHFLGSWLSLIPFLSALCAESFQLSKRLYSQTIKYYSFWKAQITNIPFMKLSQMELISFSLYIHSVVSLALISLVYACI